MYNLKDKADFEYGRAKDWDKEVNVETLACSTQWKINLVIPFVFQVFPNIETHMFQELAHIFQYCSYQEDIQEIQDSPPVFCDIL